MLVLSRKLNESILIGDQIRVTVIGVRGNYVRLGLEAPNDITILREEIATDAGRTEPRGAVASNQG